jgi:phospholipid/cholesterol/gamma-HCH transport system substrate-binding protein
LLKIKNDIPITEGTVATLNTRGVTGITFIALKDKGNNLKTLVAKGHQRYPVINTAPSIFMRLDTALSKASYNLEKFTEAFQGLLDKDNQQAIKKILHHLEKVTYSFSTNSQQIESILKNTAKASQQLTPLLQTSLGTMQNIESQTLPAIYQILNRLDSITRSLSLVSTDIKRNPAILIRGSEKAALGPGEK